ncbi:MAG: PTS sugar transporter subunit IIA [Rectinemataceae bacterium]|jgi:PTS system nitrogen regulatory IIA component
MSSVVSLADLIERGGVYYNIAGSSPVEVLNEATKAMALPKSVDRESLLIAILEREALMPTALGHGVAIPHPRNSMLADPGAQRVAVFFLKSPVAYNALDRKPVTVLFLILSADARNHLATLAAVSHLCQSPDFLGFLAKRPSKEELVARIAEAEASWANAAED